MVGETLLHYKILEKLGEGGMGVVYKAKDTKLDRVVAIKVLPPHLLISEDDRSRFNREAKAAAALNHLNIATVYEINEHEKQPFIVMEYIEGKTLNDSFEIQPFEIEETISITIQVAEGLRAAHEKGIVHRDIKAGNVIYSKEGQAKILDFGLAKTAMSTKLTQMGSTLGTVAYMSPEQVKGDDVDHRTDLWSLGVVLFEMITGQYPFKGDYDQAIFYSILNESPTPLTGLRTGVPVSLEWIVNKMLTKNPNERYQTAKDLIIDLRALDLNEGGFSRTSIKTAQSVMQNSRQSNSKTNSVLKNLGILIAGIVSGLIITQLFLIPWVGQENQTQQVVRFVLDYSDDSHLYMGEGNPLAISPDGLKLAYYTEKGLYLRYLNNLQNSILIPDTEDARNPSFSPDGNWIVFSSAGSIKKVSVSGGKPQVLYALDSKNTTMHHWSADNTIIFSQMWNNNLFQIDAAGGEPIQLNKPDSLISNILYPQLLPDGNTILFVFSVKGKSVKQLALLDKKSGKFTIINLNASYARYYLSGHIIYSIDSEILAVPFDLEKQKITGLAVTIASGVLSSYWATIFSISDNGNLVYPHEGMIKKEKGHLAIIDHNGKTEMIRLPVRPYEPRFSPDGHFCVFSTKNDNWNIWIYDFKEKITRPVTENQTHDHFPIWSINGKYIYSTSYRMGDDGIHKLTRFSIDGSQEPEVLLESQNNDWPGSLTPDGKYMIFRRQNDEGDNDLLMLSLDGSKKFTPFLKTSNNESAPTISPDGKWIAYTSDKSGRYEIYVRPFPGPGGFIQISIDGGIEPCWAPDGKTLYYSTNRGTKIYQTSFLDKPGLAIGHPELLLENENWSDFNGGRMHYRNYDVSPKGDRFVITQSTMKEQHQFIIVHNWFEELKAKMIANEGKL